MAYPATTPATPSEDGYGLPAIAGADKLIVWEEGAPADSAEQISCNPKYALIKSPLIAVTDEPTDLGVYNPELSLHYLKAVQGVLLLLQHCAYKHLAYYSDNLSPGITCINFGTRWTCLADIAGDEVTIYSGNPLYADPRNLTALTQIKPAWDSEDGEAESTNVGLSITPARFEVRLDANGYLGRAKVRYIISSDETSTVVKLTNPLPSVNGAAITLWAEVGDPMITQDFHLERRLWTKRLTTDWIAVGDLPVDYKVELPADGGGHGKIAVPYVGAPRPLLRVWASTQSSSPSTGAEITSYFVNSIASVDSKILVEESGGVWTSSIILDKHLDDATITYYKIEYCGQADPADAVSDSEVMPRSLYSCRNCKRDWSNSLANCNTIAATDGGGGHWYCNKMSVAGGIDLFNSDCENLLCDYYATMSQYRGWYYTAANHSHLLMSKNVFGWQPIVGDPTRFIGRGGGKFPSLTWMMGQREYYLTGYQLEREERAVGDHAMFGTLVDTVEEEDGYPFKRLVTGAVKTDSAETEDGLLWDSGATLCGDPLGSAADDGTMWANWVRQFRGVRHAGLTDLSAFSSPGMMGEPVQRMCNRQVTLRGINIAPIAVGVEQVFGADGRHSATLNEDGTLTVRLGRNLTVIRSGIPSDAAYVVGGSLSGDLLTLQMSPGVETARYQITMGEDGDMEYLTSGLAVDCLETQKSDNPGGSLAISGFGHADKIQKGDVIRFVNAPAPYNQIWCFVLAVDSRAGSAYSGTIDGVSSATAPNGNGHPADFEDYRLNMDVVYVWLGGHRCQTLKAAIVGMGGIPTRTYYVEAQSRAALVPDAEIAAKALQARTPTLNVYHRERTGNLAGAAAETISSYNKDAANSEIIVDTSEWTPGAIHDLCIQGQFLDMRDLVPAEMIKGLREAVQEAKTYSVSIGGFAIGVTQTTIDSEGDPLMVVMDILRSKWVADAVFTKADLEPCDFASTGGPYSLSYEDGLALYDATLSPSLVGASPAPTFNPAENILPFMASIGMHYVVLGQIPALKAAWIESAKADLTIIHFERKETYYDTRDIPNAHYDQTVENVDDLALGLFSIAYTGMVVTSVNLLQEIDLSGVVRVEGVEDGFDLKGTVDVTNLVKFLAANPPPTNTVYGLGVIGVGTGDLGNGWLAIAQRWILNFEGAVNSGATNWDYVGFTVQRVVFTSVGFGPFYITLDMDEIENDGLECPPEFFPALD